MWDAGKYSGEKESRDSVKNVSEVCDCQVSRVIRGGLSDIGTKTHRRWGSKSHRSLERVDKKLLQGEDRQRPKKPVARVSSAWCPLDRPCLRSPFQNSVGFLLNLILSLLIPSSLHFSLCLWKLIVSVLTAQSWEKLPAHRQAGLGPSLKQTSSFWTAGFSCGHHPKLSLLQAKCSLPAWLLTAPWTCMFL